MRSGATGSVVIDDKTLSIYVNNTGAPTTAAGVEGVLDPHGKAPYRSRPRDYRHGRRALERHPLSREPSQCHPHGDAEHGQHQERIGDRVGRCSPGAGCPQVQPPRRSRGSPPPGRATRSNGSDSPCLPPSLIVYVVANLATFQSLRRRALLLVSVPFAATRSHRAAGDLPACHSVLRR
jgi:hypothetical protein